MDGKITFLFYATFLGCYISFREGTSKVLLRKVLAIDSLSWAPKDRRCYLPHDVRNLPRAASLHGVADVYIWRIQAPGWRDRGMELVEP